MMVAVAFERRKISGVSHLISCSGWNFPIKKVRVPAIPGHLAVLSTVTCGSARYTCGRKPLKRLSTKDER